MTKIHLDDELKAALEMRRKPAAKSEADCKKDLVAEISRFPGGRARRVEDRWGVGVLDMNIKLPGRPFLMAEGKLIDGFQFAPTGAQYGEGLKWQAADVVCLLIGWKLGVMYISPWVKQADCRECFTRIGLSDAEILQEYLK